MRKITRLFMLITSYAWLNAAENAAPNVFQLEYERVVRNWNNYRHQAGRLAEEESWADRRFVQNVIQAVDLPLNTAYTQDNLSTIAMNFRMGLHGLNRAQAREQVLRILDETA